MDETKLFPRLYYFFKTVTQDKGSFKQSKEVKKQLLEKTEHLIKCSLSKRQRYLYDDFISRRSTKNNLKSANLMSVLNMLVQLRKYCGHPNLFEPRPVVAPFVVPNFKLMVLTTYSILRIKTLNFQRFQTFSISTSHCSTSWKECILHEQQVPEVGEFRFNLTTFVMKNPHHARTGEESEDEDVEGNGVNGVHLSNGSASFEPM
ncbi:hypothetical protein GCK72_026104 [Caenorhabditis remanei]|uniref:SNF2 N-terminal domain-containing protein n=1 Tax=Caenorhabditis remanei TaxID=31234 RepID=A0A6A5G3Y4_CAERE|nr:hypothetical protein GCK72_026104 [Caenorhabditis remanei]KAF1749636.1 hypothetical protein GCK72_026104 [Caenorhabditis remanei]